MAKRGENIYKRKDGRYEGRYIRGRRPDGKLLFGYIYAYAYAEVKQALTLAKVASSQVGVVRIIGRGSLSEFLGYWLEHIMRGQIKQSTYAQYYDRIHQHIIPALGHASVAKLTCEQVQWFVDGLCNKGLSASTITNIVRLLNSALKKAVELRLAGTNPCDGLSLPRVESKVRRALDRGEQIKIEHLAESSNKSEELAVFLALYTGLRIGEICALRWQDVDLFLGTITVRGTLQRVKNIDGGAAKTVLLEGEPKSKRSLRRIPMPSDLTDKLRQHDTNAPGNFYVLTDRNKPMEPRTLRARFARLATKAGIFVPFHALRHTFSTRCLEHNFDIQTLSELLGHASAGITMKIYAHSLFEHKRLLTERIGILSKINEPSNKPSEICVTH